MTKEYLYSGKVVGGSMDGRTVSKNDPPRFKKWISERRGNRTLKYFQVYHWVSLKGVPVWRYSHDEPDTRLPEPEESDEATIQKLEEKISILEKRLSSAEELIDGIMKYELEPLSHIIERAQAYHFKRMHND